MNDPLLQLLDGLPSARLDPARANRIRVRCHAVLVRQRGRAHNSDRAVRRWPPIAVGLGGLYLTEVLHQVLALYGIV
jgi:hypothetical protein